MLHPRRRVTGWRNWTFDALRGNSGGWRRLERWTPKRSSRNGLDENRRRFLGAFAKIRDGATAGPDEGVGPRKAEPFSSSNGVKGKRTKQKTGAEAINL